MIGKKRLSKIIIFIVTFQMIIGQPILLVYAQEEAGVISETGNISAFKEALVFSKMAGRIEKINVEVGSVVKKGDVIAVLDSK